MATLKDAENKLEEVFKGLPKLSSQTKESLAKNWAVIALVIGILQLIAAYFLFHLANYSYAVLEYATAITGQKYGPTSMDKMMIYLGVILLAVEGVIFIMAYAPLKARARRGWDLLFMAALLNVAYAVVQIFTYQRGFGSFVMNLLGSAIGLYFLFQIREKFGGKTPASPIK